MGCLVDNVRSSKLVLILLHPIILSYSVCALVLTFFLIVGLLLSGRVYIVPNHMSGVRSCPFLHHTPSHIT